MNINIVTEWEKHIFITKNVPRPLVPKAQTVGVPVMGKDRRAGKMAENS